MQFVARYEGEMVVTSTVESKLEERTRRLLNVPSGRGSENGNFLKSHSRRFSGAPLLQEHASEATARFPCMLNLNQIKARAYQLECYTDVREGVCNAGFAIVLFLFS